VDGIGVNERDLEPEQTGPGTFVDQICAGACKLGQRCIEIVHLVGDVVHSRAALREEAADRSVVSEGLEQLDATVADSNRGCAHTLILDRRAMLDLRAEQTLVSRESGVEILDRNSQMMDPPRLHASDAIR
jgi:hypothetical protein